MKKTEKMIHQNIRFRSRIDTFLVSIEEFPRPSCVMPEMYIAIVTLPAPLDDIFPNWRGNWRQLVIQFGNSKHLWEVEYNF